MKNIHLLFITLGGSLLLIFGVTFLFARQQEQAVAVNQAELLDGARHSFSQTIATATPSASIKPQVTPSASDSATPSADQTEQKITVVEFSDFQCPACRASAKIKNEIFTQFPTNVEFVYRHFPLTSIHDKAILAAQASEAASKFNKFWEMHDQLFENQESWEKLGNDEAKKTFIDYAVALGINKDDFAKALEDDTVRQAVQMDADLANKLNLSSTPTFFVNDKKVSAPEVIPTIEQLRQS